MLKLATAWGLGYRLDGNAAFVLDANDYAQARPISSLTSQEKTNEGIQRNAQGEYFVVIAGQGNAIISGKDGDTLILPRAYVASRFGQVMYPVIAKAGKPTQDLFAQFYANDPSLAGVLVGGAEGFARFNADGVKTLATSQQLSAKVARDPQSGAVLTDSKGRPYFVYYVGGNQLMLNVAGTQAMNELARSYFVVSQLRGDAIHLVFATEAQLVRDWEKLGLTTAKYGEDYIISTTGRADFPGAFKDEISGEYRLGVSLPISALIRTRDFYQGDLYFDAQTGFNTQGKGAPVLAIRHAPDIARGYLDTAVTSVEELTNIGTVQAEGSFWWYRDANKNGVYDEGEPKTREEFSATDRTSVAARDYLFAGYRPLLRLVDAAGNDVELSAQGQKAMEAIYRDNLLLVKYDFTTAWIPNATLQDPAQRAMLGETIYQGGTLMRLGEGGKSVALYYPDRAITDSKVMVLANGIEGAPVYGLHEDLRYGNLLYYSKELGVKSVRAQGVAEPVLFMLAEHYTLNPDGTQVPVGYVGYDAWGKVFVEGMVSEGQVKSVIVNLDEPATVMGDEALAKAEIPLADAAQLKTSRIFSGFDSTFNLADQIGWAVNFGEKTLTIEGREPISFVLTREIILSPTLKTREFGIADGKERIKIKFDRGLFIVSGELLGSEISGTYVVHQENGVFKTAPSDKISRSKTILDYKKIPQAARAALPQDGTQPLPADLLQQLPPEFLSDYAAYQNMIRFLSNTKLFGLIPGHKDLTWSEIDVVTSSDEVLTSSYQAFEDKDTFTVNMQEGMVDLELRYGTQDDEENISIRLRLADFVQENNSAVPVAIAAYINQSENLIFNLEKRLFFVEVKDPHDYHIIARKNVIMPFAVAEAVAQKLKIEETVNNALVKRGVPSDRYKEVFVESIIDALVADWRSAMVALPEIKQCAQFVDREELFAFSKKAEDITDARLQEQFTWLKSMPAVATEAQEYPFGLVGALGVPARVFTSYYIPGDGVPVISFGDLAEVNRAQGYLRARSTVICYERQDAAALKAGEQPVVLGTISRQVYRDFLGRVMVQQEAENSIAYIFDYDESGVGQRSLNTSFENGQWYIDTVSFYLGRETAFTKFFPFITLEGNFRALNADGTPVVLSDNAYQNYQQLLEAHVVLDPNSLKPVTANLKDGEGRIRVVLSDYRGDVNALCATLNADPGSLSGAELIKQFREVSFSRYKASLANAYEGGPHNQGYGEESYAYAMKFDENGIPVLDEFAYRQKDYLTHTNDLEPALIDGKVYFSYRTDDRHPGRELQQRLILTPVGKPYRVIYQAPKVRVVLGWLGNATKGTETIEYGIRGNPAKAVDDKGRTTKQWEGIQYAPHPEGGTRETHTILKGRELAPGISDRVNLILHNGQFEDEGRVGWFNLTSLLVGTGVIFSIALLLVGIIAIIDKIFKTSRLHKARAKVSAIAPAVALPAPGADPLTEEPVLAPSRNAYGFEEGVVQSAWYRFETAIIGRLERHNFLARRGVADTENTLVTIADEYFEHYNVWLATVLGQPKIDFSALSKQEVMELLWISFMIRNGCIYFQNDTPSFLDFMMYKAFALYRAHRADEIGELIRKESTRWFTINHFVSTAFKSIFPFGPTANTIPFQYLFTLEDIEDLFRTAGFIEFYDALSGVERDYLYDTYLIPELKARSLALQAKAKELNTKFDGHKVRIKKQLVKTSEYKAYVRFLVQEWRREKPLFVKSYCDTIGFAYGIGSIKTWLHTFRNLHQPLSIPLQVTLIAFLCVALFQGLSVPYVIGIFFVTSLVLWSSKKGITLLLDNGLAKRANMGAYGKPVSPDEGYSVSRVVRENRYFRYAFWTMLLTVKFFWNVAVFKFVLITHIELWGAAWAPLLSINLNVILIAGLWLPFVVFFFLDTFSIYYLFESVYAYISGKWQGLGVLKAGPRNPESAKNDIWKTPVSSSPVTPVTDNMVTGLIKRHFIPQDLLISDRTAGTLRPLSAGEKEVVTARIINLMLTTLADEDMITQDELERNLWEIREAKDNNFYAASVQRPNGFFSDIRNQKVLDRIYRFLNGMLMDRPDMPIWERIRALTIMTPTGPDEMLLYPWVGDAGLNQKLNSGYTALTWLIKRYPDEWENFIQRMIRLGRMNPVDLAAIRALRFGDPLTINDQALVMEIRFWASNRGQPYFRTLNGKMHYVSVLQLLAAMNHPEWSQERIQTEVGKKFQILWGYYYRQNATKDLGKDVVSILKYFYDRYDGFLIDLTDIPNVNGVFHSVLQHYRPGDNPAAAGSVEDVISVPLTSLTSAMANEGKPGNQTHNRRFIRGEVIMTFDMNQDYYIEQALSIPVLLSQMDERNGGKDVAIVGYPEDIFTDSFSLIGRFHAVADRTFNSVVQRTLTALGARFHYGHPDIWRTSVVDAFGGVSRSYPVNEDIYGGYEVTLKGKRIINVEYIEAGKAREVSWVGTDGIFRKFGMGAVQQMYGRTVNSLMNSKNFDWARRLTHIYGGIGYYLRKPIITLGIYFYLGFMMLIGVSGFSAFPYEAFFALLGILVFAQAITSTGVIQEIIDKNLPRGLNDFFVKTFPLMSPFFMAHVFTQAVGAKLAMAGVAAYVATGRGFRINHFSVKTFGNVKGTFEAFGKSHIVPAFVATVAIVTAITIWINPTLIWSVSYIVIILATLTVPVFANRASLPIFGVSMDTYRQLRKQDFREGIDFISEQLSVLRKDRILDAFVYAIALVAWLAVSYFPITVPVVAAGIATGWSWQALLIGIIIGLIGVWFVPRMLNIIWNMSEKLFSRNADGYFVPLLLAIHAVAIGVGIVAYAFIFNNALFAIGMAILSVMAITLLARLFLRVFPLSGELNSFAGPVVTLPVDSILSDQANLVNLRAAQQHNNPDLLVTPQLWESLSSDFKESLIDEAKKSSSPAQLDSVESSETKAKKLLFDRLITAHKVSQQKVVDRELKRSVGILLAQSQVVASLRQVRQQGATQATINTFVAILWARLLQPLQLALLDLANQNQDAANKALFDALDKSQKVSQQEILDRKLMSAVATLLSRPQVINNLRDFRSKILEITAETADLFWQGAVLTKDKPFYRKLAEKELKDKEKKWDDLTGEEKQTKIEALAAKKSLEYSYADAFANKITAWNIIPALQQPLLDVSDNNSIAANKALFDTLDKENRLRAVVAEYAIVEMKFGSQASRSVLSQQDGMNSAWGKLSNQEQAIFLDVNVNEQSAKESLLLKIAAIVSSSPINSSSSPAHVSLTPYFTNIGLVVATLFITSCNRSVSTLKDIATLEIINNRILEYSIIVGVIISISIIGVAILITKRLRDLAARKAQEAEITRNLILASEARHKEFMRRSELIRRKLTEKGLADKASLITEYHIQEALRLLEVEGDFDINIDTHIVETEEKGHWSEVGGHTESASYATADTTWIPEQKIWVIDEPASSRKELVLKIVSVSNLYSSQCTEVKARESASQQIKNCESLSRETVKRIIDGKLNKLGDYPSVRAKAKWHIVHAAVTEANIEEAFFLLKEYGNFEVDFEETPITRVREKEERRYRDEDVESYDEPSWSTGSVVTSYWPREGAVPEIIKYQEEYTDYVYVIKIIKPSKERSSSPIDFQSHLVLFRRFPASAEAARWKGIKNTDITLRIAGNDELTTFSASITQGEDALTPQERANTVKAVAESLSRVEEVYEKTARKKKDPTLTAWLGEEKEIIIGLKKTKGALVSVDARHDKIFVSWRAVRGPPELLQAALYFGLTSLIYPQYSPATLIQLTVSHCAANSHILASVIEQCSSRYSGIKADADFLRILIDYSNRRTNKYALFLPRNATMLVSVQDEINARTELRNRKILHIDGKPSWFTLRDVDQHVKDLSSDLQDNNFVVVPHADLYFNLFAVIYHNGTLYRMANEHEEENTYTCFVAYRDGRKEIREVVFRKSNPPHGYDVYIAGSMDAPITEQVVLAVSGRQIIKEGKAKDLSEIAEQFDDIRHLFAKLPIKDADGNSWELLDLYRDALRVKVKEFLQHGHVARSAYPLNILGLTKTGDIIVASFGGNWVAGIGDYKIEDAAALLVEAGMYQGVLISEGGDANLRYNNQKILTCSVSFESGVRTVATAAVVFAFRRRELTMLQLQDMQSSSPAKIIGEWSEVLRDFESYVLLVRGGAFSYERNIIAEHWERIRMVLERRAEAIIPYEIEFQPESACNLRCKHCVGRTDREGQRFSISSDAMRISMQRIVEFNANNPTHRISRVRFSGLFGEPLLNKEATLVGMREALAGGLEVGLFTNGVLLDEEVRGAILGGIYINISLDAGSRESFLCIKGHDSFWKVIKNIARLARLRNERDSRLNITVSYVLQKDNYNEIYALMKLLKAIGVDWVRINMNLLHDETTVLSREEIDEAYSQIRRSKADFEDKKFKIFARYSEDEVALGAVKPQVRYCYFAHLMSVIACDGVMYSCDHYAKAKDMEKVAFGIPHAEGATLLDVLRKGREKLEALNPSEECQFCACMPDRANIFMNFLDEAQSAFPHFLDYVELAYVLSLKLDYIHNYLVSGELKKAEQLFTGLCLLANKHEDGLPSDLRLRIEAVGSELETLKMQAGSSPIIGKKPLIQNTPDELMELYKGEDNINRPHAFRVALYAQRLACALHLPTALVREMGYVGLVHDLGGLEEPKRIARETIACRQRLMISCGIPVKQSMHEYAAIPEIAKFRRPPERVHEAVGLRVAEVMRERGTPLPDEEIILLYPEISHELLALQRLSEAGITLTSAQKYLIINHLHYPQEFESLNQAAQDSQINIDSLKLLLDLLIFCDVFENGNNAERLLYQRGIEYQPFKRTFEIFDNAYGNKFDQFDKRPRSVMLALLKARDAQIVVLLNEGRPDDGADAIRDEEWEWAGSASSPVGAVVTLKTTQEIISSPSQSVTEIKPHYKTVVIGAGPAGLSAAYHLGDDDFILLEKEQQAGGTSTTWEHNGYLFDSAIHVFFTVDASIKELVGKLLNGRLLSGQRRSYIYYKNRKTEYPFQANLNGQHPLVILDCIAGLVIANIKRLLGLQKEPADFALWSANTFGSGITRHFGRPFNQKVWGVALEEMSCHWVADRVPVPRIRDVVRGVLSASTKRYGPNASFAYPEEGGIKSIADAFLRAINPQNVLLGATVSGISLGNKTITVAEDKEQEFKETVIHYDRIISSMPLPWLIALIHDAPGPIRNAAAALRSNKIFLVNLGVGRSNISDTHWMQFPEDQYVFYRVSFPMNLSPNMAPEGKSSLTAEICLDRDESPDDDSLVKRTIRDLTRAGILLPQDTLEVVTTAVLNFGYVVPVHGSKENVELIHRFLAENGIDSIGRFGEWEYFNIDHAIKRGKVLAEKYRLGSISSPIDIANLSQVNLQAFWKDLRIAESTGRWGTHLRHYIQRNTSQQFYAEVSKQSPGRIDLHLGGLLLGPEFQAQGWQVSEVDLGAKTWFARLFRLQNDKGLRYVFSGILSNRDLHNYMSMLKFLAFPLHRIAIVNDEKVNLKDAYIREIQNELDGVTCAVVALRILADPLKEDLKKAGWVEKGLHPSTQRKFAVFEKNGTGIVIAYIDVVIGDACAVFMDALYAQGIRNFVFWGTTAGMRKGQDHFDAVIPSDIHHVYSTEQLTAPRGRVNFVRGEKWHTGELLNTYARFYPLNDYAQEHRDIDFVAVEMELFGVMRWLQSRDDAILDVHLNIDDHILYGDFAHLLTNEGRQLKFSEAVRNRTQQIVARLGSSPVLYSYGELKDGTVRILTGEIDLKECAEDGAIVKILLAGICRADVKEVQGSRTILKDRGPLFGHELVGVVAAAGKSTHFKRGDRVVFNPNVTRNRTTGFAEYFILRDKADESLIRVPARMPSVIAVFAEPFSCILHSVKRLLNITGYNDFRGKKVAIIGAGNAGLSYAWLVDYLRGEATVFNLPEPDPRITFIHANKLLVRERIRSLEYAMLYKDQFDFVVVTTTLATTGIIFKGIALVKPSGYVHLYGGTREGDEFNAVNIDNLRKENIPMVLIEVENKIFYLSGAYGTTTQEFLQTFSLFNQYRFSSLVRRNISGVISLRQLPELITAMAEGSVDHPGKVVVKLNNASSPVSDKSDMNRRGFLVVAGSSVFGLWGCGKPQQSNIEVPPAIAEGSLAHQDAVAPLSQTQATPSIRAPPQGAVSLVQLDQGWVFNVGDKKQFAFGAAEQNTGSRHISSFHTDFLDVVSPIEDVAAKLVKAGTTVYKIYLPPNNPTNADFKALKQLIARVYKQTGLKAVVLSFAGLYAGQNNVFYLADPSSENLAKVKQDIVRLGQELNELGAAVLFAQLGNENDYYCPGAGTKRFGGNAWDTISLSPAEYYKFMDELAALYIGKDAAHPVFLGHGGMSEQIFDLMQNHVANFSGIALNLYPNWNEGRPARRVMSVDELTREFGYHIRLAAHLKKPVVLSEFGESSFGAIGEEGQAAFASNAIKALSKFMAGAADAANNEFPKVLVGAIWHERRGESWKNGEIHPSEEDLELFDDTGRAKPAFQELSEGFSETTARLTPGVSSPITYRNVGAIVVMA
ncbi:MAG: FAD-dependent oxidoreductase, partial [Candidatus Omnitrophica bacterium]|nr:FAD-dependent oxidoreductase [Candidatus Omnitrophota bacterium]